MAQPSYIERSRMNDHNDILGDITALQNRANTTAQHQQAVKLFQQNKFIECETLSNKILNDHPEHADSIYLLGFISFRRGELESAIQLLKSAINLNQKDSKYFFALSLSLNAANRFEEALNACNRAIELNSRYSDAHLHRGTILKSLWQLSDAEESLRFYIELNPDIAAAHESLASVLNLQGRLTEAEQSLRRALNIQPNFAMAHSNLIFLQVAQDKMSCDDIYIEQRHWDEIHGKEGRLHRLPARTVNTELKRRLRIGYVSPDFRTHAVSSFFEPLLAAHNRSRFEIFCYATHVQQFSDFTTERLKGISEHWNFVTDLSDLDLAQLIHDDEIDILIDLAGHTGKNRLKTFTYKPAPIQASYLGFFGASGLEAMDYWITDDILHPESTQEKTIESIYRLPRCSFCYQPPAQAPALTPCPNTGNQVVFGSFHHRSKITAELIDTWSEILKQLPESKLFLMDKSMADAKTRHYLIQQFIQNGVSTEQLSINTGVPYNEYLTTYSQVDIILDSFPRTGGTTTAEALWMGIPVITLAGRRYAGRISASKLMAVGLNDLIAHTQQEYIDKAISLAYDPERRINLRSNLRKQMAESPLCDGDSLANAIENAYLEMWKNFSSRAPLMRDIT